MIYDDTVASAVRTVRKGTRDGANAFELNLPRLGYPPPEGLVPIFQATDRPIFTSCRRAPFTDVYGPSPHLPREMPDDERMVRQLDALAYGSAGIDMELDTFDPHPAPVPGSPEMLTLSRSPGPPAEVTEQPAAIGRQRAIIDQVHTAGGEVVMSCHAARVLSRADAMRIAALMTSRGADLVKIVGVTRACEHVVDLLGTTLALKAVTHVPFSMMSVGGASRIGRFLGPMFGSSWAFGQARRSPGGFDQMPLVRELRAAFGAIGGPQPGAAEERLS